MAGTAEPAPGSPVTAILLVRLQERLSKYLVAKMKGLSAPEGGAAPVLECNAVCSEMDVVAIVRGADLGVVGRVVMEATEPMRYPDSTGEDVDALPRSVTTYLLHPDDAWTPADEAAWTSANRVDAYVLVDVKADYVANAWRQLRASCAGNILAAARLKGRPTIVARITAPSKAEFDHLLLRTIQSIVGVQATRSFVILRDEPLARPAPAHRDDASGYRYKERLLLRLHALAGEADVFVPFSSIHLQEKWKYARQLARGPRPYVRYRTDAAGIPTVPREVCLTPEGLQMARSLLARPPRAP